MSESQGRCATTKKAEAGLIIKCTSGGTMASDPVLLVRIILTCAVCAVCEHFDNHTRPKTQTLQNNTKTSAVQSIPERTIWKHLQTERGGWDGMPCLAACVATQQFDAPQVFANVLSQPRKWFSNTFHM